MQHHDTTARSCPSTSGRSAGTESYPALLARLSRLSVTKHFDAYADVDWDAPEHAIDPDDLRWALPEDHPLGATAWYRSRPEATRARLALHLVATQVKLGLEFERTLKQGLLEFASTQADGAPEFRYAYHEVIEEAQHSSCSTSSSAASGSTSRVSRGSTAWARAASRASGGRSRSSGWSQWWSRPLWRRFGLSEEALA